MVRFALLLLICNADDCVGFLVKGIYVQWSNEAANPKVKDWNVTVLHVR